jgi:transcriptional regulator of heat shock response
MLSLIKLPRSRQRPGRLNVERDRGTRGLGRNAQLSLIGLPVMLPGGVSAVIAVLGPMRMNYGRVISAVQHVGQAFGSA